MTGACALAPQVQRIPEPDHRRTHAKLRRSSKLAGGKWERGWNERITWEMRSRILLAAELLDESSKKAGQRTGEIGLEGLKVLKLALNMLHRHGRFDMSYDTIAQATNVARSCVARVLKRLQTAGFLSWTRRFVPTGEQGVRGPQYEQASNLYRATLPEHAAKLLGVRKRREPLPKLSPPPADAQSHEQSKAEAAARYRAMADDQDRAAAKAKLDAAADRGYSNGLAKKAAHGAGMNASPPKGLNP